MTQKEIQQKAYKVYPLDIDRHFIIEGEPYDNNKEKREAYIRGLTDSKPSLPSNLDEAAKKYELSIGSQDYCYMDIEDAFKAGAEWMAEQFQKIEGELVDWYETNGVDYCRGISTNESYEVPEGFYIKKK